MSSASLDDFQINSVRTSKTSLENELKERSFGLGSQLKN